MASQPATEFRRCAHRVGCFPDTGRPLGAGRVRGGRQQQNGRQQQQQQQGRNGRPRRVTVKVSSSRAAVAGPRAAGVHFRSKFE